MHISMENHHARRTLITKIIHDERVSSQEDLLEILRSKGYELTQATLSRDLKQLRVIKMPDEEGFYRYSLPPDTDSKPGAEQAEPRHALEGFLSVEFSGNLAVIRTVPAYSHAIASAIDANEFSSVAGTVAGNDTIMVVLREGCGPEAFKEALLGTYPGLKEKLYKG